VQETIAAKEPYGDYLETLRQRRLSENTLQMAGYAFLRLEAFLQAEGKTPKDVALDDLDRFQRSLLQRGLAAMTVDAILRNTQRLFRWLARTGRIFLDPAALWSLSRPKRPLLSVPTEKQVAALLAQPAVAQTLGLRDRAFIETAYSTGARLNELAQLTIHDPDLDRGLLRVLGKGRKERLLPLGKQAVHWLRMYLREAWPKLAKGKLNRQNLWLATGGRRIAPDGLRQMLGHHCQAAGLPPILPHALRRACATHMLQHGAHPVQIQLLLGHADLSSLSQYLRLTIADIKRMHRQSKVGK
jgi:integrase/recombinase XerD